MQANKPELMWARQHWNGEIWEEGMAHTIPMAKRFPPEDPNESTSDEDRDKKWGEVKLFRVTIDCVSPTEQAEHLAKQEAFFKNRRTPTEPPKEQDA